MAITGIPVTAGDDVVTVTPIGHHSVNADAGNDILILDYSSRHPLSGYRRRLVPLYR